METELTKRIKAATHYYHPKLNAVNRTIRWADEVTTSTGIVDSIRFEDYIEKDFSVCTRKSCKNGYVGYGEHCKGCIFPHREYQIGMMITCYEVKITYSDFKSENGHNIHGNENYYCVPKVLASKIADEIPDDIGILAYYESERHHVLRQFRSSGWREVSNQNKVFLLYNAMKKWCDGNQVFEN